MPAADSTGDLVDDLMEDHMGVPTDKGDYTSKRNRCTRVIQRAANYVWNFRDWSWAYVSGTVSVAANANLEIAADTIQSFGRDGGVWIDSAANDRPPLTWIPYHRYLDMYYSRYTTGEPRYYAEGDQDTDDGTRIIYLFPDNDATRTFAYTARSTPPTCVYESEASSDELFLIPMPWRRNVIYEWAVYYLMKQSGNMQSRTEQKALAQEYLGQMAREERDGRNAPMNLAPYGRRRRYRR
jgi:hypothetical protein